MPRFDLRGTLDSNLDFAPRWRRDELRPEQHSKQGARIAKFALGAVLVAGIFSALARR